MVFARLAAVVALISLALTGCGLGLPPAGDYATVYGQVTNAAGQPVQGATVLVNDVLTATTDATGNFTVSPVPTGAWSYTVTAPNYKNVGSTSPPPLTPGEKRDFPIRLTSQNRSSTAHRPPGAAFQSRVRKTRSSRNAAGRRSLIIV
ncbi:MAG: carboxypeptidase-like regulatory domain-containing protein [Candidatus Eremiobacteraeota bacterium]|nr:carboxypeptidase-like regulatory domain-containing protein [Candidatus Eremiobacteraeota bacterium]